MVRISKKSECDRGLILLFLLNMKKTDISGYRYYPGGDLALGRDFLTWALMGLRAGLDFSENREYMGVTCEHPSSNILSLSDFRTDHT